MPRNMSFALTTKQILNRTKTVTRRKGWRHLRPGDLFWACEKCQGLKKGEKVRRLALLRCLSNQPERLCEITAVDVRREGFPKWTPQFFIAMFLTEMGGPPTQEVQRIAFKYVDDTKESTKCQHQNG